MMTTPDRPAGVAPLWVSALQGRMQRWMLHIWGFSPPGLTDAPEHRRADDQPVCRQQSPSRAGHLFRASTVLGQPSHGSYIAAGSQLI